MDTLVLSSISRSVIVSDCFIPVKRKSDKAVLSAINKAVSSLYPSEKNCFIQVKRVTALSKQREKNLN